jgi:23S rRNA U2552 (ribose-2'-O)-methylase RlmE/FtsJ
MNYSDVIHSICSSMNCKLYLELGCQFANTARKMIAPNRKVIGVDVKRQFSPGDFFFFFQEPTDDFFKHFSEKPDVIFIDANHNIENVKRDFINSINCLNKGGIIFIHDTDPNSLHLLQPEFCDEGYKIIDWIRENYKDLDVMVLPIDEPGLTLIKRKADRRILDLI